MANRALLMVELRPEEKAELRAWAASLGVSMSDVVRMALKRAHKFGLSPADQRGGSLKPGIVMWGGKAMREGRCPAGNTCLACDRLGKHLEPVT